MADQKVLYIPLPRKSLAMPIGWSKTRTAIRSMRIRSWTFNLMGYSSQRSWFLITKTGRKRTAVRTS